MAQPSRWLHNQPRSELVLKSDSGTDGINTGESPDNVPVLCNLTGLSCPNMPFCMHQVYPTTLFVNLHEIALIYHDLIDLS